jgi:hypothetical protein
MYVIFSIATEMPKGAFGSGMDNGAKLFSHGRISSRERANLNCELTNLRRMANTDGI